MMAREPLPPTRATSRRVEPHVTQALLVAPVATLGALVIAVGAQPTVPDAVPMLFLAAVALTSASHGLVAGTLTTLLSVAAMSYAFVTPLRTLAVLAPRDVALLAVFGVAALVVAAACARVRRRARRAERAARDAELFARLMQGEANALRAEIVLEPLASRRRKTWLN